MTKFLFPPKITIFFFLVTVSICLVAFSLYDFQFGPVLPCGFRDGPFKGKNNPELLLGNPEQTFLLENKFNILVHYPKKDLPVLELKDSQHQSLWKIELTGHGRDHFLSLELKTFSPPKFWWGSIEGKVRWQDGEENISIFLSRSGQFGGFCLSW